jgi:hypothetical protein
VQAGQLYLLDSVIKQLDLNYKSFFAEHRE